LRHLDALENIKKGNKIVTTEKNQEGFCSNIKQRALEPTLP
jgi:hypothetical protein